MEVCGNDWGDPWGVYWPPCDPIDQVFQARRRARQRLLLDPTFDAFVRLLGEALEDVEFDAWQLYFRMSPTVATGKLLDEWGRSFGFPKPSLTWDSTKYRRVMGAWINARRQKSLPNLFALLDALADQGETWTVTEFTQVVVIEVDGISADTATIWAEVLEAARPKTVGYWLTHTDGETVWIMGESELGVDTILGEQILLGP